MKFNPQFYNIIFLKGLLVVFKYFELKNIAFVFRMLIANEFFLHQTPVVIMDSSDNNLLALTL